MQYVLYPVVAALLVVLLVLYRLYDAKQQGLKDALESRMERLRREMTAIESDMRKMTQRAEAAGKELTSLRHGLTSVSNQIVGIRAHETEHTVADRQDTEIRTLEIVGMRTHDPQQSACEREDREVPTIE